MVLCIIKLRLVPERDRGQTIIVVITERLIPDLGSSEFVAICEADDTDTSAIIRIILSQLTIATPKNYLLA